LSENDRIAQALRVQFAECGTLVLNCISSPGSGKTSLLERTLEGFSPETRVAVVTGDIQTDNDARRLARFGFPSARSRRRGRAIWMRAWSRKSLHGWDLGRVGSAADRECRQPGVPTSYDLGEESKIVILSVTEGDDKPLKYPGAFAKSRLMVLNKIDLLPYVPFDMEAARRNARSIHPDIEIIETSCTWPRAAWTADLAPLDRIIYDNRSLHLENVQGKLEV
jgi:hydrogenase nickel incorporation protein HypB